ncbi:MAG TPA: hypothetical protein PKZ07_14465 [Sedimentisphaerales bacterium]|nr:hypothetical protein [Sedimentisphaerales bacterium]
MTNTQPSEARLKLLAKIKALADRGVDGEKRNAKAALDRYLRESGMDVTELEALLIQAERKPRYFAAAKSRKNELHPLWLQIISMALNDTDFDYIDYLGGGKWGWEVNMTGEEYAKALSYWIALSTNYWLQRKRYLEQQEQVFTHAYVEKHNLYAESATELSTSKTDLAYVKKLIAAKSEIDRVDIDKFQAKLYRNHGKRLGQGWPDTK